MPFDYPAYMATYNKERKRKCRAKGICIDCRSPSPRFFRCFDCRSVMQEKARDRYAPKVKRNRELYPV